MIRISNYSNPGIYFPDALWPELISTSIYILNKYDNEALQSTIKCRPAVLKA